ncbi:MAG: dihydroorotate dehydrogenase electron transfer subunit [Bacillota bacterium]
MYSKKFMIKKNEEVIPGHRLMCLDAPEIAAAARPGQFLHIRCPGVYDPLLRRPLSVHFADRERGHVYALYRVAGKGTSLFAAMKPGDLLDVMGPLGNGYTLPGRGERVAVLGGGIGAAPLFFLLGEIKEIYSGEIENVEVLLGAATAAALPGVGQIRAMGFSTHIATDDGSEGFRGSVVELYKKLLGEKTAHSIYACGPLPMLMALSPLAARGARAEVSVEEIMGCGVGACLSCVCKVKSGAGEEFRYAHVCTDGPVFDLRELVF